MYRLQEMYNNLSKENLFIYISWSVSYPRAECELRDFRKLKKKKTQETQFFRLHLNFTGFDWNNY